MENAFVVAGKVPIYVSAVERFEGRIVNLHGSLATGRRVIVPLSDALAALKTGRYRLYVRSNEVRIRVSIDRDQLLAIDENGADVFSQLPSVDASGEN